MRKHVLYTDKLMRPIAHFSHAIRIGDVIYVGATAGTDPFLQLAGTRIGYVDATAQTNQMLDNLDTVLGMLDANLNDIVKVKTYLADPRDLPSAQEIVQHRLGDTAVKSYVGSHGFPLPQAAVELDAIAILGNKSQRLRNSAEADALRVGERFYATVRASFESAMAASSLATQIEAAFDKLAERLSEAALRISDIVHLHATLSHLADAATFRRLVASIAGDAAIATTIIVAPLPHPGVRFQIEVFAFSGGARWIGRGRTAVQAGDEIYFASQLGCDSSGASLPEAEQQIDAAWRNIEAQLLSENSSLENVVLTKNALADWRDYAAFNRGYGKHVARPYPPRTTILANLEDPLARVQIEGIAYVGFEDATIVDVMAEG